MMFVSLYAAALYRMSRWNEQFGGLGIQHLRSPTNIHPDPSSSYALEIYADRQSRNHELVEMRDIDQTMDFRCVHTTDN